MNSTQNPKIIALADFIKENLALIQTHNKTRPAHSPLPDQAARIIQRTFRKYKIKETIFKDPYRGYLSMMDKKDEQYLISQIMFGKHQAEIQEGYSPYYVRNPYIHKKTDYHRVDELAGLLLDDLLHEFNLSKQMLEKEKQLVIPVMLLNTTSIDEMIEAYCPSAVYTLIKSPRHSIAMLVVPHIKDSPLPTIIKACGLVASPWEIARNIKKTPSDLGNNIKITLDPDLPHTTALLHTSPIYAKLKQIAVNPHYPTQKLTMCLLRLLSATPNIHPDALRRIALMLDMTTTFYANNYPRFAFCVYTIIHELTLALLKESDAQSIEHLHAEFVAEAKKTGLNSLDLTAPQLTSHEFVAVATMSGTHAYTIALELAKKMQTSTGKAPVTQVVGLAYFEFNNITKNTDTADADIFIFSAGPVINHIGGFPGLDINKFIQRVIINSGRRSPVTLIIDATSALYKNLKLTDTAKSLVESGQLSIIIHESHQKFGLIHSDQAQHGRVMALCSKQSYAAQCIEELKINAIGDFSQCIDMRIGAFISVNCSEILEDIKQQHFSNGAFLRHLFRLIQSESFKEDVVTHEDMLSNLNELYFIMPQVIGKKGRANLEFRNSFGHFSTTAIHVCGRTRLSADASDHVDRLFQFAMVYIAENDLQICPTDLLIKCANSMAGLEKHEQIVIFALIISAKTGSGFCIKNDIKDEFFSRFCAIDKLLKTCDQFVGRSFYANCLNYLDDLKRQLIDRYKPKNKHEFIHTLKTVFPTDIAPLYIYLIASLKEHKEIREFISRHKKVLSKQQLSTALVLAAQFNTVSDFYQQILNEKFCQCVLAIVNSYQSTFVYINRAQEMYNLIQAPGDTYLTACYLALNEYFRKNNPRQCDLEQLANSLEYCKTMFLKSISGQDKTMCAKIAESLVNPLHFITFLAPYLHQFLKQKFLFFPTSSITENDFYKKIITNLNDIPTIISSITAQK